MSQLKKHTKLFQVIHPHFSTDRYESGITIVEADSKEEAMQKLNDYLFTKPDGVYTDEPCKKIEYVSELQYLS